MSVQLMTGNTAVPVPSVSDGSLYAGIIGTGSYVQKIGKMCAASLDGPNKLVVQSGSIVHNGRHIRMLGNTEFTIPSGLQAQKRSNLCVIRYKSEPDGGESVEHLVLTGEAVSDGEPPDPEINSGSILDLATVSDMPLYRVVTDGINALDPEPLFNVMVPMSELWDSKSQLLELGPITFNAPASSNLQAAFKIEAPTGFIPVGIVSYYSTGDGGTCLVNCWAIEGEYLRVYLRNISSAKQGITARATVALMRA